VSDRSEVVEVSTADAAARMATEQARFRRRWLGSVDDFNRELDFLDQGLDPSTGRAVSSRRVQQLRGRATARFSQRLQDAIEDSVRRAHQAGTSIWGGAAGTQGVAESVDAMVLAQRRWAARFALDVSRGIPDLPGRMSIGARTILWQNTIEGAYQLGTLSASPDGWLIWWNLGGCFHCCFTGSSRVATARGWIPISRVRPGDQVITHRGRFRSVVTTHQRLAKGREDNRAVVLRGPSGSVGLTGDHKVLTPDGWKRAADVASLGLFCVELPHVEIMRTLWGEAPREGPYEPVPKVSPRMRMRAAKSKTGGEMHGVRQAEEEQAPSQEMEGPGISRGNGRTAPVKRGGDAQGYGAPHTRIIQAAPQRRPILRHDQGLLIKPIEATPYLPLQMALGTGQRADPAGHGNPPQEQQPERRPPRKPGTDVGLRSQKHARGPTANRAHMLFMWDALCRFSARDEDWASFLRQSMPGYMAKPAPLPPEGDADLLGMWDNLRSQKERGPDPEDLLSIVCGGAPAETIGELRDGAILYDITVEDDHSFILEGLVVSNCDDCPVINIGSPYTKETLPTWPRNGDTLCRQNCCCFLEYRRTKTGEDREPRPEGTLPDRILKPVAPPGKRLPTRDEQIRLWDLESKVNHARRQISLTEGSAQKEWIRTRREANRKLIELTKKGSIHHVPTFGVKRDILTGLDVTPGDVSALTHFRGIDGTTISRVQARAIQESLQAAEKDLAQLLNALPALEAVAATERLPGGPVGPVMNLIGDGVPATLRVHLEAVRVLAAGDYVVEFGPLDSDWPDLVMAAGSWVQGESGEVERFLAALSRKVSFAPAPWQERG